MGPTRQDRSGVKGTWGSRGGSPKTSGAAASLRIRSGRAVPGMVDPEPLGPTHLSLLSQRDVEPSSRRARKECFLLLPLSAQEK